MIIRSGKCLCGELAFEVRGAPLRVGVCHCTDCRKASGSSFNAFAIWPSHSFSSSGEFATFNGQSFCPKCGSRAFAIGEEETEVALGALDMAPTDLEPTYELWIKRRENWLEPLPNTEQHDEDRSPRD